MEMALEHLDLAIRCRDEQEATAFFHRGWCRMTLGDMVGASSDFDKVAALDPQVQCRCMMLLVITAAVSSPLLALPREVVPDCELRMSRVC